MTDLLEDTEALVRRLLDLSQAELDALILSQGRHQFKPPNGATVYSGVNTVLRALRDLEFEDGDEEAEWPMAGTP